MRNFENKLTLLVVGCSGSGKGTQANFILRRLGRGSHHLETGRFIRALVRKKKNLTTDIVREVANSGGLVSPWFAAFTWLRELIEGGHADKHLVADGSPRSLWEAKLYDDVMRVHKRMLPLCVYLDVSMADARRRLLLRARGDDTPRAIRNRMAYFEKEVRPMIRYYRRRRRLIVINGNPAPEVVWIALDHALAKRLGRKWPRR